MISDKSTSKLIINEQADAIFKESVRRALTKSAEYVYAKAFEKCPGYRAIRPHLFYTVDVKDINNMKAIIGVRGEAAIIAKYVEFGTGLRGSLTNRKYFKDEKSIHYTIPIVPTQKLVLHWVTSTGQDVFAKSTKGQNSNSFLRSSLHESIPIIKKFFADEIQRFKQK